MVKQKIKDINGKLLKNAQGVMAVLELLGLDEDDLLLLKEIPQMKEQIKELEEFKQTTLRTLSNQASGGSGKSISQIINDVYGKDTKEFNPHNVKQ